MHIVSRRSVLAAAAALVPAAVARERHPMSFHLSCGSIGVKASQKQAIDYAAEYGFDSVDANGDYLGGLNDADLQSLLDDMRSKHVEWAIAGFPVEFRKDDGAFSESIRKFPAYVAGLKRAGVTRVTTWILSFHSDRTYRNNFAVHAARLREAASILSDSGMRLGLEYLGPKTMWASQRFPFIHSMAEMKELIAEIGRPNVGFVLDSWHWYNAGDTGDAVMTLRASDVVSVDLNDAPSGIPIDQQIDSKRELPAATGVIDVRTFLSALKKIGYTGPVRAEPFNEPLRRMAPNDALAATMAALNKAFSQIA